MIFTTYWFLVFAVACVSIYWVIPISRYRLWFLAAACLVFHAHFAGPAGMIPIIVLMVITYLAGLSRKKSACIAAMILCALTLGFYKYASFLVGSLLATFNLAQATDAENAINHFLPSLPPLGISFFTFEFVHYLFEIKRGGEPIRNPLKFLLFSIFFPSLVAGPIKRYTQFLPSLVQGSQRLLASNVAQGLQRIAVGYAKKLCIADNLTFVIDQYQSSYSSLGIGYRWAFMIALAARILADFSGYTDIAVGFARLLGVRLPENFDWPYLARNLQDFWQRWHISLTSWIRDYIYIPLGGNRLGLVRRTLNGILAFAICGLWHGAAWHFIFWGLFHGFGLGLCATYKKIPGVGRVLAAIFSKEPLSRWFITQLYVGIGWFFFFYPVAEAWRMTTLLFRS